MRNALEREVMIGTQYRVIRVLGRGGPAITYEAEHVETKKRVALKHVTLDALDESGTLDALQREARALCAIKHPSIPRYIEHFSVETIEGPAFCLVQDLAPGRSLAEWRTQGWHPDEAEVKRLAFALLEVLRHLHSLTPPVLHRNLNPHNIFREPGGKLWVVDFGVVRDSSSTTAPGAGAPIASQGYVAPEQLQGSPRAASDLYGIGTTLLFLMTGRAPGDLPQREKKLDFRSLVNGTPGLKAWLGRMVDPLPDQRFASAHLAIADLRDETRKPLSVVIKRRIAIAGAVAVLAIATVAAVRAFEVPHSTSSEGPVPLPPRPVVTLFPAMRFAFNVPAYASAISSVAFTPDGSGLLTSSGDAVKMWDTREGKLLRTFSGHTDRVSAVRATPEGRYVVSGGDSTVRIWDLQTGLVVRTIPADAAAHVTSIAISTDGRSVASAGLDGTANTWFVPGGGVLRRFDHSPEKHGPVLSVVFSPDGRRVVTAGSDGALKLWDAAVGTLIRTIAAHTGAINVVVFAPDGQTLASGGDDHLAKIWDATSGALLSSLTLHTSQVMAAAFSPDGRLLVTSGNDGVLAVWDPKSGLLREQHDTPGSRGILGLAISKDGSTLASAHGDGSARVWQMLASMHTEVPSWKAPTSPPAAPVSSIPEERSSLEAKALLDRFSGDTTLLDDAETRLNAALEKNPRYAPALTELARVDIKRADGKDDAHDLPYLQKALELTEKALLLSPTLVEASAMRAWAFRGLKDSVRARILARDAEKIAPASPDIALVLLTLAKDAGDLTGAETTGRGVLEKTKDPHLAARTFEALITVYRERGDYGAMDQAYRRTIELEPESAWNKGNYAQFLIGLGEYEKAIAMAQSALGQKPYAAGQRTLAEAYCAEGVNLFWERLDPEPAKAAFDQAIAADPTFAESYYGLGAYYVRRHAADDATRSFKKALALAPDHPFARAALVSVQQSD